MASNNVVNTMGQLNKSIGVAFHNAECLPFALAIDDHGVFRIEEGVTDKNLLILSLEKKYDEHGVGFYEKILMESSKRSNSRLPLKVGLLSGAIVVSAQVTEDEFEISNIFNVYKHLHSFHVMMGNSL